MSKNEKKKKGRFLLGALIGAGLGILFAPAKGSETRRQLGKKLDDMVSKIKEIDLGDVKEAFDDKIDEIRVELEDLDKEKIVKMAKEKAASLKVKAEELFELAKKKGTPILQDAAKEVLENVVVASKEIIKKLEPKKETTK
ncbi:MAG: YtxH domain-containing protein [Bacilli bacterium]|nr:YtxH domain-containing protein [Bacilli bacterium]